MPDFLIDPKTFTAAEDWFSQKADLPTDLGSGELAQKLPAPIRNQAFFSAKVSSAHILSALRAECQGVIAGQRNPTDAVARLRQFLADEGYGIPPPKTGADRNLQDLASDRRLRLVVEQNVSMAHAVGQRMVSEHPYVAERFPNYRYIANTSRHSEFDGLVLPKSDPFWARHYPPWDYNCQCIVVDEEGAPDPSPGEVPEAESGFTFLSHPDDAFGKFDSADIADDDLRQLVDEAMAGRGKA